MSPSVTSRVKDYGPILALLHSKKVKKHVKKTLLSCPQIQDLICICVLNVLKGRLPLSESQKKKLKKYKKTLLALSTRTCSRAKKHRHITQEGGFLLPLLGPVLGAIGGPIISAIAGLIKPK